MKHLSIIIPETYQNSFTLFTQELDQYISRLPYEVEVSISADPTENNSATQIFFSDPTLLDAHLTTRSTDSDLLGVTYVSDSYDDIENHITLASEHPLCTSVVDFYAIGMQRHLISKKTQKELFNRYFEAYNLGDIAADTSLVEPCFRDSHIAILNTSAIKYNEFQSKDSFNPSGFNGIDFIQFCRYAGISNRMEEIHFTGIDYSALKVNKQDQVYLAQCIYYFLEGLVSRKIDNSTDEETRTYVFDAEELGTQVNFIEHLQSGRWWMNWENNEHNYTVSSHKRDYMLMKKNLTPDRLMTAFYRHK